MHQQPSKLDKVVDLTMEVPEMVLVAYGVYIWLHIDQSRMVKWILTEVLPIQELVTS